jgi:1,4-alpha-glucan branching enzyme
VRRARQASDFVAVVLNWTPVVRDGYRIGVPEPGYYQEILNSDAAWYGGVNIGNQGGIRTDAVPAHGHAQSLRLTLPPLAGLILKRHG